MVVSGVSPSDFDAERGIVFDAFEETDVRDPGLEGQSKRNEISRLGAGLSVADSLNMVLSLKGMKSGQEYQGKMGGTGLVENSSPESREDPNGSIDQSTFTREYEDPVTVEAAHILLELRHNSHHKLYARSTPLQDEDATQLSKFEKHFLLEVHKRSDPAAGKREATGLAEAPSHAARLSFEEKGRYEANWETIILSQVPKGDEVEVLSTEDMAENNELQWSTKFLLVGDQKLLSGECGGSICSESHPDAASSSEDGSTL